MSYHFKSLRSRFAEFHAEFNVCSLLQFHVHAEITNVKVHVVTNTRVVQLPMLTQRTHSRTAIGWWSVEQVLKLFDTPMYVVIHVSEI